MKIYISRIDYWGDKTVGLLLAQVDYVCDFYIVWPDRIIPILSLAFRQPVTLEERRKTALKPLHSLLLAD